MLGVFGRAAGAAAGHRSGEDSGEDGRAGGRRHVGGSSDGRPSASEAGERTTVAAAAAAGVDADADADADANANADAVAGGGWRTAWRSSGCRVACRVGVDGVTFSRRRCRGQPSGAMVMLKGAVSNWEEVCELYGIAPNSSPAAMLLQLYIKGFADVYGDWTDQPSTCLAAMQGDFALILHDPVTGYLMTARSCSGGQPLYWGLDDSGDRLMLSSDPGLQLSAFPAGCFYERWIANDFRYYRIASFMHLFASENVVSETDYHSCR